MPCSRQGLTRVLCLFGFLVVPVMSYASDVIGPTYPILEEDFVAWMKARFMQTMSPNQQKRLANDRLQVTREYLAHPPGRDLPRTVKASMHWVNPSVTVPYDLRDESGRVIHTAGTTINPLSWLSLTHRLLLFDGTDKKQVAWARRYATESPLPVKEILVAGSPADTAKKLGRRVFFDQRGVISTRFGVKQVPAVVRQDGLRLRVDEVTP